ncbi:DNA-binding transcriptional LysR family regulator [Herbaspirillum sp. Sphag1AN]|uniref:LysR family transcriptional regulator n=1 Tax=unclassified Herbaspirillum TaxID=2624150 RepID=UPI001615A761|nr:MULTISPECIES: LysR family transcriptional regulator [unclassified Herbaspirillum]MBB3211689.1 DNA-binding transcriptional LysR family regulator [Herbaspirillum sp. Sphag1AN]MBB3245043.1 DNA-binding transcriptional LysR family regulator [Herbaspirillum sp. Sphag64]
MRLNKLDLNLLVALDVMLSEVSVTAAAERMHMSQSAMSNALGRLREHFGDKLLVQVGRRMEITPRGLMLREAVRDVLMRIDTSIMQQPEFDPASATREFKILVSDYSLMTFIPHLITLAAQQSPGTRFHLLAQVEGPEHKLEHGEADMVIIPGNYCSKDHPQEFLWQEEFVCLMWDGNRLAQGALTLNDYLAAGHIRMQPAITTPSIESAYLMRAGIERRIEITTHNFLSVPAMLIGTERIATVHRRLAHMVQRIMPVAIQPLPINIAHMEQCVQWHKYRTMDPGLIWLRDMMQQAVKRMNHDLLPAP